MICKFRRFMLSYRPGGGPAETPGKSGMMRQQGVAGKMKAFRNPALPLEERIDDLMSELTVDEKLGLLNYRNEGIPRLGIPPYVWWNEALHGLARSGSATVFPQAIAMAATFSPELVERMGEVVAEEGRARHFDAMAHGDFGTYKGLTYWSPNVNIFRDPRWGRGQETYGECPFLTGEMGAAYVRGVQGNDPEHLKAVATPKHFAVHSGPEKNRLAFDSRVSEKDLRETYLPAFHKCIEAGAQSVMSAYNAVNGTPCSLNARLLNGILREEWGFDGAVVTDAGAGEALVNDHRRYSDYPTAVADELRSGVDLLTDWATGAREAWARGLIAMADLDRAVRNQLRVKFRLGFFDPPHDVPSCDVIECAAHRKLALDAARRGIVLLKNAGNILPLNFASLGSVAVIGPNADSREVLMGNYFGTPTRTVTLLEGILAEAGDSCRVIYARGCEPVSARTEACAEDFDRIAEAVGAAERADVAILCLGLNPLIEGEAGDAFNSEAAGDKIDLELPGVQKLLLERVAATGTPVVLVAVSGSALALPEELASGVIECFYPGAEGGTALAEVLSGRVNPSGRLPVTFYRSAADLPPFDDYAMAGRTYRFFAGEVLHPFGFGLSYTTWSFREFSVPERGKVGGAVNVELTVENTGDRAGETVVQVYVSAIDSPTRTALKQLAGMRRVALAPGESERIALAISPESFLLTFDDGSRQHLPGRWRIEAAFDSRTPAEAARIRFE